jgi:hypothetical protein
MNNNNIIPHTFICYSRKGQQFSLYKKELKIRTFVNNISQIQYKLIYYPYISFYYIIIAQHNYNIIINHLDSAINNSIISPLIVVTLI